VPRLIIKSMDEKTIDAPDGNTLRANKIRGGGMELRRALSLQFEIEELVKNIQATAKAIDLAHISLSKTIGTHRRRGSTPLVFTDKIFKQIKQLGVYSGSAEVAGPYSPTPFLQMEAFRLHAILVARAIAGHATLINRLYNRRTNQKRRALGTSRPAAFGLATSRVTHYNLPRLEWRLSMRLPDGRYLMRAHVQRTTYSRAHGKLLRPRVEPVSHEDGALNMTAVAYASLLHMGDEYHCLEAARFTYSRTVSTVVLTAQSFMSTRQNMATARGARSFNTAQIDPKDLQISTVFFAS
jgi:hypothetical protein